MPTLDQTHLPLVFTLSGGGVFIPLIFGDFGIMRPETYSMHRLPRATVTQTLGSAFIDDFGEGPGQLLIAGHTGWGQEDEIPGIAKLKAIEALFVENLARRVRLRDQGLDPNVVQLWLFDALNLEALSLFPLEFALERNRSRPLLYFYRMRFIVVADLLQQAVYHPKDFLTSVEKSIGSGFDFLRGAFAA